MTGVASVGSKDVRRYLAGVCRVDWMWIPEQILSYYNC